MFGSFWHRGRCWNVHSDSHYYRLLEAWQAVKSGHDDPFEVVATAHGDALDIAAAARDPNIRSRPKHLYVYAMT